MEVRGYIFESVWYVCFFKNIFYLIRKGWGGLKDFVNIRVFLFYVSIEGVISDIFGDVEGWYLEDLWEWFRICFSIIFYVLGVFLEY